MLNRSRSLGFSILLSLLSAASSIAGGKTSGRSIGVAPGAGLMVAKAFDQAGWTETSRLLAALQWMADPDGNPTTVDRVAVCSCSWGDQVSPELYATAIANLARMGTLPCFAIGNRGPGQSTAQFPGALPPSFAVGATDPSDSIANFSSRGPATYLGETLNKPDVCAPGKGITSAKKGGGYAQMNGTSMATPHVSGLSALLLEASPALTVDQLRNVLERSAVDLGEPGKDNVFGSGRVDAMAAVALLRTGARLSGTLESKLTPRTVKLAKISVGSAPEADSSQPATVVAGRRS